MASPPTVVTSRRRQHELLRWWTGWPLTSILIDPTEVAQVREGGWSGTLDRDPETGERIVGTADGLGFGVDDSWHNPVEMIPWSELEAVARAVARRGARTARRVPGSVAAAPIACSKKSNGAMVVRVFDDLECLIGDRSQTCDCNLGGGDLAMYKRSKLCQHVIQRLGGRHVSDPAPERVLVHCTRWEARQLVRASPAQDLDRVVVTSAAGETGQYREGEEERCRHR